MDTRFRPHKTLREDRLDGTIILRSGYQMGPVANTTGDWLHRWAEEAPDRVFLAERSGAGWRTVTFAQALEQVRAIGAALLGRGLTESTPILVISGNSVNHGLLSLAAQYVGIPIVPVAEQYALIPGAAPRLIHAAELVHPGMVFAESHDGYDSAVGLPVFDSVQKVVGDDFNALLKGDASIDIDAAHAKVGPDTVGKILMTSGSTSSPKGVLTTHRMMCANQAQIADAFTFLNKRPPVLVDWLPWNHVFGGSHNFNIALSNGGSLYIDNGKPTPTLIDKTIENLKLVSGSIWFNVPLGFALVLEAMRKDDALKRSVFADLDMLFYAGASLPADVWDGLKAMAQEVSGQIPLMTSSWGLTETAPAALAQHEPTDRSGVVGVPMTGTEIKLVPDEDLRCEVRVKGPNVMTGYFEDPEKTAAAFDEEGFFITGDAMKFVNPEDPSKGLKFDGRISEDFKLMSGTWVRAANLRLEILTELAGIAQDVVITGEGRDHLGLLVFPVPGVDGTAKDGVITGPVQEALRERLKTRGPKGSSEHLGQALIVAEPASLADGEITAKGNLNFAKILSRRADLVERLYDDNDPAVVRV